MFGVRRHRRWLRQINRLEARIHQLETMQTWAYANALRWKTALDGANKGARRKSAQARMWRTRAEAVKLQLDAAREWRVVAEAQYLKIISDQSDENTNLLKENQDLRHRREGVSRVAP